jgi:hypothetical protein
MLESKDEKLGKVYDQLCVSYRAIDDFRAKLLGFLPLATSGGIFILLGTLTADTKRYFLPVGLFGFVITVGLFFYEIYGIRKCHALIAAGTGIENALEIDDGLLGQFNRRPRTAWGFINEPVAAGIIYPAVMAAWIYIALVFTLPPHPPWRAAGLLAALLVFACGAAATLRYEYLLRTGRIS